MDPGNLRIRREILVNPGTTGVDTAVFSSVRADYTVTVNPNGSVTVRDDRVVARNGGRTRSATSSSCDSPTRPSS